MDGLAFASKYQFTEEARQLIADVSLTERLIDLGTERVIRALKGENPARMLLHESEIKEDIASFAAARMIIGALRSPFVTNTFAVSESKRVRSFLNRENDETLDRIAERFGIRTVVKDGAMLIDIPAYLRFSPRSQPYRLINRRILNGNVEIVRQEKLRLIEEAVKKHIESIPLVKDPPDQVKRAGERILANMPRSEATIKVIKGDHPPCIAKLLESMKKHENLNHHARWFLATYLLAINMNEDGVAQVFSDAPDYNERTTRYQIAHAKKKGYSVPACTTVMSYGLCTALCRIGSPIRWHQLDSGRKEGIRR